VNDGISKITGKSLKDAVIAAAFKNLTFSEDPVASSLVKGANDAYDVGIATKKPELDGIYELNDLNAVLKAASKPEVAGA